MGYDWSLAEHHFRNGFAGVAYYAVDSSSVPPLVRVRYVLFYLAWQHRYEEAYQQCLLALETDPLSMIVHFALVLSQYWLRHYDNAIQPAARALEINPDFVLIHMTMGMAKVQAGRLREAAASFERVLEIAPWHAMSAGFLAGCHARLGNRDAADKIIAKLEQQKSVMYVSESSFAIYYVFLGNATQALAHVEAAVRDRDPQLLNLGGEPLLDPFQPDPRYQAVLRQMNIAARPLG